MTININDKNLFLKRTFHIVPFEYEMNHSELRNKLLNREDWSLSQMSADECDLYDHIQNEVYGNCALGCVLANNKKLSLFDTFIYYKNEKKYEGKTPIEIGNFKLFLYKNGIGFFVYEIKADTITNSERYKVFLNKYKELSYLKSVLFEETEEKNEKGECICNVISLGVWIANLLKNLTIRFVPNRTTPFTQEVIDINTNGKEVKTENEKRLIIYPPKNCTLRFPEYSKDINIIPDKAICFSYVVFNPNISFDEITEEERRSFSYYSSRGFKNGTVYYEQDDNKPYKVFRDTYWNACQEGCSYVAFPTKVNENDAKADKTKENLYFYENTLIKRIEYSYLYLYIRSLYESRSILKYSRQISEKLSFSVKEYNKGEQFKEVSNLYAKINLFRTKVLSSSVSFTSIHVDFYHFVKGALHIDEDAEKLTQGLDALNDLQSEINSNKVNFVLTFISSIQAITLIASIFDLVCIFINATGIENIPELMEISPSAFKVFVGSILFILAITFYSIVIIKPFLLNKK